MQINPAALKAIRQRSGMTITALAESAGCKQAHLSNIEAGRRQPSDELIVGLADALKVDLPAILLAPPKALAS